MLATKPPGPNGPVQKLFQDRVIGKELTEMAADHVPLRVAEHLFRGLVPARQNATRGHRKDGVGRRTHDGGQLRLGRLSRLPFGYVPYRRHDQGVAPVPDGGQADVDREL